jgi:hypothetical protein
MHEDRPTLVSGSEQSETVRGVVVAIPAGTPAGPQLVGASLRLAAGTWAFNAARLVAGVVGGETVAAAPSVGDPTFPVQLVLFHGRGAARWCEVLPIAARGCVVTRTGDYMEAGLLVVAPGFVGAERVLLAASQIISPVVPSYVSTGGAADGAGALRLFVPVGAKRVQFLGAVGVGVALNFLDAANNLLAQTTPGPDLAAEIAVPLIASHIDFTGLAGLKLVQAIWEVWG